MTTPPPAPEVLEAMRAAFKQRSSQMMGDLGIWSAGGEKIKGGRTPIRTASAEVLIVGTRGLPHRTPSGRPILRFWPSEDSNASTKAQGETSPRRRGIWRRAIFRRRRPGIGMAHRHELHAESIRALAAGKGWR